MLVTPHAVAGATIAVLIPHPLFALPLALGSHYVLDAIPHWQECLPPYKVTTASLIRVPVDVLLSTGIVWAIALAYPANAALICAGALTANIPDIDTIVVALPHLLKKEFIKTHWDWHSFIQWEVDSYWGLVPQIALCALCLFIIS